MKELKFRAWHKIFKNYAHIKRIWLDGDGDGHDEIFAVSDAERTYSGHEVVLEQYTFHKDKNGKEIYEGDIIRCHGDDRFIAPVIRHAKSGGFCWVSCYDEICFIPESDEVEVIGNVNENPELMEEK